MAQGVRLSDQQIETIRAAWVLTGNGSYAAKAAGCATSTANKYIKDHHDELRQLRQEKAPDIAEILNAVLNEVLSGMLDPSKVRDANLNQLATTAGIVIDKMQLLSGQATARTETMAVDPGRLTPEEREQARRLRAKLLGEVPA